MVHVRRSLNFGALTKLVGIFLGDSGGGKFEIQPFKVKRVRSSETFEFSPALKKQRYASQSEKKVRLSLYRYGFPNLLRALILKIDF